MGIVLTHEIKQILWELGVWVLFGSLAMYAIIYTVLFIIPWCWDKTKWMRMNFCMWLGYKIRKHQRKQRIKRYNREIAKYNPPTFRPPYWDGRRGWR